MGRVPVIVHEQINTWARQLRPRLRSAPVRWFESRSSSSLERLSWGLASPLVVIDLGRHAASALDDVDLVVRRSPSALVLVLDPEGRPWAASAARELGATHVLSGFAPPPLVAGLLGRWIGLARQAVERSGWSRTEFPETGADPWGWLFELLDGPTRSAGPPPRRD